MKEICIIVLLILCLSGVLYADYTGTEMELDFKDGVSGSWSKIYVVWIENEEEDFLQHLYVCNRANLQNLTGIGLPYWQFNKRSLTSSEEVDLVTGATQKNTDFTINKTLNANISNFRIYFEVDHSYDGNDWFSDQPAILYAADIDLTQSQSSYDLQFVGWTYNGREGVLRSHTPTVESGIMQDEIRYITHKRDPETGGFSIEDLESRMATYMVESITLNLSPPIRDITPPTTPTGLMIQSSGQTTVDLVWISSTDNVGVTGYRVYRNGSEVGTTATNSYTDTGLDPGTQYSYTVAAYDAAGNDSEQSEHAVATTHQVVSDEIYYIDGVNGDDNNDGSDWSNAWTDIPATLERGAVYYLADGIYSDCILDDVEDGDEYITIKKATFEDHGTDQGWDNSYGDGQAIFNSIRIRSDYWMIDGSHRERKDSGHGIKLEVLADDSQGIGDYHGINVNAGTGVRVNNIRIKYVEFAGMFGEYPEGDSAPTVNGYEHTNGGDNLYIGYCYFHHFMGPMQRTRGQDGAVYEHNYYQDNKSYPDGPHGDAIQLWNSKNSVIRFNEFCDIEGTAFINLAWDVDNIHIYGNTFYYSPELENDGVGNGIAAPYDGDVGSLYIYNNTMANSPTKMFFNIMGNRVGTEQYCYNNLWYNCYRYSNAAGVNSSMYTHGYNFISNSTLLWLYDPAQSAQITSIDPFVSSTNYDFHLSDSTGPAKDLSQESWWDPRYDSVEDADGNIRGEDGSWDMGAYEYRSNEETAPAITQQPSSVVARAGEDVSFSVNVIGNPVPTYQWQKDGEDIPGANEATLIITDVQSEDAGEYGVIVSNSAGTVTSNLATLTIVDNPPVVPAFNVTADYYTAYLYWENPEQIDEWDKVVVIRKNDSEPSDHNDGEVIYEGIGTSLIDRALNEGTYYYAVYTSKEYDGNNVYSEMETIRVDIPETYNKNLLRIEANSEHGPSISIGQNTRGDLYTLWDTEEYTLGRGTGGNETGLWIYSDIVGNSENQIPLDSKIINARLVFNVEDAIFNIEESISGIGRTYNNISHSINVYRITDPDELGRPHYADKSGLRVGLDFNYRDHRPGMNIPWIDSDETNSEDGNDSIDDSSDILDLFESIESEVSDSIDTLEFNSEIFENEQLNTLQFDITEAVKSWVEGIEGETAENQGIYITIAEGWDNGDKLTLFGVTADENEQLIRPYLEIIYADSNETGDLIAPEPVESLKVSVITSDSITLNWINPDINQAVNADITGIKIVRKEGIIPYNHQDGELVSILTGESYPEIATEYVDTGLTSGTSYYYAIYTFDEEHNYSRKAWIKGTPGGISPADAPANFTAAPEEGTALLSWDSVTGADNYRIYRESESGLSSAIRRLIAEIYGSTTSYTDYLLTGKYTYWIAAVNDNSEGLLSGEITIEINEDNAAASVPSFPSGIEGSGISVSDVFSDITLSWTDNSDNESVFIIEREVGEDQWKEVGRTGFNVTEYIYQDTLCAGQYNYRLRAVNSAGSSQASMAQITIDEAEGVYDISWEVISASQIKLIWQDYSYQNNSYQVQLYEVDESGVIDDNDEAVDTQTVSGKNYCYFVKIEPGKEYRVRITNLSSDEEMSIESDIIRTSADSKGGLF